ncbi:MAG: methylenetetrahydrofolate reductase [Actinomyces sp.]|uniref:methylenetetrahydrofolate reductase n=1 Tax=Actinomyces sp. TaxID=29317 RepID=UPI0026DAC53D|nr:methylenetetrahydrofolate reductase [Actinomyces sp.]MDO4243077.1 methylenetetrahydrofolate reductase [Actinomyces sp.]
MTRTHPGTGTCRPSLSLELFPPRPGPHSSQTWGALGRLLRARPDFVSVTYRPRFVTTAGGPRDVDTGPGSPRPTRVHVVEEHNPSEDVVAHVLDTSEVPLMAHMTCIGYRKRDAVGIVRRFLDMGVRRFLALRGDPPAGVQPDDVVGELPHAEDLVRVIREVEAEYFDDGARHLQVAVAAYPADVDHGLGVEILAAKQAAGADLAISQVFYEAEDYLALTRSCLYSGVSMPILPGIIPLTDLRRLTRLESLTGVCVPTALRAALSSEGAVGTGQVTRGIDATLRLATEVLEGGAPGLHLYTFNRTRPALDVISQLRLGGILSGSVPSRQAQHEVSRDYLNASPGGDRRAHPGPPGPGWPAPAPRPPDPGAGP